MARLILQYFQDEYTASGVPLVSLDFDDATLSAPYLCCTELMDSTAIHLRLDASAQEFLNALLSDIEEASLASREAALTMMERLEAIEFGPIRAMIG